MKQKELLKIEKEIYKFSIDQVNKIESHQSPVLINYKKKYNQAQKRAFQISSEKDLLQSVLNSQVTFIGDFHTFDQNTRNLERILRCFQDSNRPFTMALEMIHIDHQHIVDAYIEDHITEKEFLEEIHYHDSWRFPWTHYRRLFTYAKTHKIPVIALNSNGNLISRDLNSAEVIFHYINLNPIHNILVFYGEYHIIEDKIPGLISDYLPNSKQTIIHQNLDEVFWNLRVRSENSHNSIIKFSDNEFSLQTSPPWVKYESYIYWHHHLHDDPEFDLHEWLLESGAQEISHAAQEKFIFILKTFNDYFELPKKIFEKCTDFNLTDHNNLEYVLDVIDKNKNSQLQRILLKNIKQNKSTIITGSNIAYCPNFSFNKLAYLVGMFIGNCLTQLKNTRYSKEDLFITFFNIHFWGHLCAKVINPSIKCDLYIDLKKSRNPLADKACIFIESPQKLSHLLVEVKKSQLYEFSELVAQFYAEIIYQKSSLEIVNNVFKNLKKYIKNPYNILIFHKLCSSTVQDLNIKRTKKVLF